MKIGDLKNQLRAYLQHVRNGDEVVVRDRNLPVARILPFHLTEVSDEETRLVASGALKLPEQEMDWDSLWSLPKGNVTNDAVLEGALESRRGDR